MSVASTSLFSKLAQDLFAGRNGFAFPFRARLFVMLALLQLGENPRLLTFPFEAAKRILESLVFFDVYERHPRFLPPFWLELWARTGSEPASILGSVRRLVNQWTFSFAVTLRFNRALHARIPEIW
jgi:hypothetical protein